MSAATLIVTRPRAQCAAWVERLASLGTTAAALSVLMAADGLDPLLTKAVAAAAKRGKELAG